MTGIHDLGLFLISSLIFTMTPGQDTFYILGRSLAQGRKAGIASVLGISAGALCHTAATVLGLSALLAASPNAFLVIRLTGAAYLSYLGIRMLASSATAPGIPMEFSTQSFSTIFRQGFLTNLLNPKVALFFLSFIPQFVAKDAPDRLMALLALSLTFLAIGTTWCFCLAWFSSKMGDRLRHRPGLPVILNRVAGVVFILLGIRLALSP